MSQLPKYWAISSLGEVTSPGQYGWTTKAANQGSVKYLRTTDISSGHVNWETVPYCQEQPLDIDNYRIQIGDILISRAGSVGFNILIEDIPSIPSVFASYLIRFIPSPEINTKFISHFLKSQDYWQQIASMSSGIALSNVNAKKLASVVLPIPPLNEQKRIADKLDFLLARVDKCQEHLGRVPQILKRFRQSVLAAAMSGKLTEEWRNEKNLSIYGWEIKRGDEIFSLVTSGSRGWAAYYANAGAKFLRVGNLDHDTIEIDLENIQHISLPENTEGQRTKIEIGDILISITADVGMVGFVRKDIGDAYINQHICLVRQTGNYLGEFLAYFLASPTGGKSQLLKAQRGATKAGLTLGDIKSVNFQLPTLDEQYEIVRRIENLFALANQIEARWQKARTCVSQLTPAMLAKAFRGELVEQDPNDEPAFELLERIKMARANAPKEPKKPRRRADMTTDKTEKDDTRLGVIQALEKSGKELSAQELFQLAGYPLDAESGILEEFFVEVRDALIKHQISKERRDDMDWFSLKGATL